MLNVDKMKTQLPGDFCGTMEVFNDCPDLSIGEQRVVMRQTLAPVEDGVMVQNTRLVSLVLVGTAEASGVRQLQADQQVAIGPCGALMLFDQSFAQSRQPVVSVGRCHKLIRISASFMGDCDGFSSPDQFRAASPKTLPSTQSARGWITVSCSIPALHRLHGNPVSYFDCTPDQRLQQRRFWSANQLAIAGNVQTQLPQVLFEAFDLFECAQPRN